MRYLILLLPVLALGQAYPVVSSLPVSNGDRDIVVLMSDSSYYRDTGGGWTKLAEKPINTWTKVSNEPAWTVKYRSADSTNSTRTTGTPMFQFNLDAASTYEVDGTIYDSSAAATTGLVSYASFSAAITNANIVVVTNITNAVGTDAQQTDQLNILTNGAAGADTSIGTAVGFIQPAPVKIYGQIVTKAATPAVFTFGWKSEIPASGVTIMKNSYIRIRKMPY